MLAALVLASPGVSELHRLDLLPRFKEAIHTGSVSSYDRTGGNDDGFSGAYSFVRKDERGLVLADLNGPGVVYRIWTPTPTGDPVEFLVLDAPAGRLGLAPGEGQNVLRQNRS